MYVLGNLVNPRVWVKILIAIKRVHSINKKESGGRISDFRCFTEPLRLYLRENPQYSIIGARQDSL